MDMFPDTAMVRDIQQELDKVIQQGVRNITRLIRANDPTVADGLQTRGRGGPAGHGGQRRPGDSAENSLSDRLVKDGLLTADLLRQLQREWSKEQNSANQGALKPDHHRGVAKGKRRNKK